MPAEVFELKCYRCRLKLPVAHFSKAARRNPEPDCKRCTAWVETLEPDIIPPALETGHVSIEEKNGELWIDGEAEYGEDEDEEEDDLATIDGASQFGSTMGGSISVASSCTSSIMPPSEAPSYRNTLPPHLQRAVPSSYASSQVSSTATGLIATRSLPPHLSRTIPNPAPSESRMSSACSVSTATTIREDRRKDAVPFNCWDSSGIRHMGLKTPTVVTGTASVVSRDESAVMSVSDWSQRFPQVEKRRRDLSDPVPHVQSDLAKAQINEGRVVGFHSSDNEWDSDDDDWM